VTEACCWSRKRILECSTEVERRRCWGARNRSDDEYGDGRKEWVVTGKGLCVMLYSVSMDRSHTLSQGNCGAFSDVGHNRISLVPLELAQIIVRCISLELSPKSLSQSNARLRTPQYHQKKPSHFRRLCQICEGA
jgi:hypothetical protein